jgi:hypothetical protein
MMIFDAESKQPPLVPSEALRDVLIDDPDNNDVVARDDADVDDDLSVISEDFNNGTCNYSQVSINNIPPTLRENEKL